jgi:hypothetical protein
MMKLRVAAMWLVLLFPALIFLFVGRAVGQSAAQMQDKLVGEDALPSRLLDG